MKIPTDHVEREQKEREKRTLESTNIKGKGKVRGRAGNKEEVFSSRGMR